MESVKDPLILYRFPANRIWKVEKMSNGTFRYQNTTPIVSDEVLLEIVETHPDIKQALVNHETVKVKDSRFAVMEGSEIRPVGYIKMSGFSHRIKIFWKEGPFTEKPTRKIKKDCVAVQNNCTDIPEIKVTGYINMIMMEVEKTRKRSTNQLYQNDEVNQELQMERIKCTPKNEVNDKHDRGLKHEGGYQEINFAPEMLSKEIGMLQNYIWFYEYSDHHFLRGCHAHIWPKVDTKLDTREWTYQYLEAARKCLEAPY